MHVLFRSHDFIICQSACNTQSEFYTESDKVWRSTVCYLHFTLDQSECSNLPHLSRVYIIQCSSWSWKTTGRTNLHKEIFIVNPRWRRCPTRITTWCTKIAPPFALIGGFLQLQAQNNADESPKKPKGSRKMTGRWKNDRAVRKNDRALNKTTGRCALSFRPSENPVICNKWHQYADSPWNIWLPSAWPTISTHIKNDFVPARKQRIMTANKFISTRECLLVALIVQTCSNIDLRSICPADRGFMSCVYVYQTKKKVSDISRMLQKCKEGRSWLFSGAQYCFSSHW